MKNKKTRCKFLWETKTYFEFMKKEFKTALTASETQIKQYQIDQNRQFQNQMDNLSKAWKEYKTSKKIGEA